MTNQKQRQNSCRMERTGIVVDMTDDQVRLEVEGKQVTIPRSKIPIALVPGDRVCWSGSVWEKIREEEVKNR